MKRLALFVVCALLGSLSTAVPAEQPTSSAVLDLLEASLTAGEGVPAQVLLQKYLDHHPRTSRVVELEVLAEFYAGDYEAAADGIAELRKNPRSATGLGPLVDVIVNTYETTKNYETFTHENYEVRYAPGPDEILVPYAIDTLKAASEALEAELGVKMVSPIRLEIYPDAESLARVSTLSVEAIRTTGTIALCKWGRLMIASPAALMHGYPWLDTIAHEYVHLLLTKATLDQSPVWLQEGLAKFLETRWRQDQASLRHDPASNQLLHDAVEANELLDFDQLHPSIALLPTQEAASLAFAQVSSFIEMYYREYGRRRRAAGALALWAMAKTRGRLWRALLVCHGRLLETSWKSALSKEPKPPSATADATLPQRRSNRARRGRGRGARAGAQVRSTRRPPVDPLSACGRIGGICEGARGRPRRSRGRFTLRPFSHRRRSPERSARAANANAPAIPDACAGTVKSRDRAVSHAAKFGRRQGGRRVGRSPTTRSTLNPTAFFPSSPFPKPISEATLCSRLGGMRE